jgi:hypothetical protein
MTKSHFAGRAGLKVSATRRSSVFFCIVLGAGFAASAESQIRIHAGGGAYTDSSGNPWSADANFQGGSTYATSASISNTADPALYQSERYGNMQYAFNVPSGTYSVTLKFVEDYHDAAGRRIFNVAINNQPALSNFDIFAAANGEFIAVDRTFQATVTNGMLTIAFSGVVDNPKIDAIQILPQGSTPAPPTSPAPSTVRVHAGGGAYTDTSGNVWSADDNFQGGSTYATTFPINNTPDPALYQTERYGNSQYSFSVPNGAYTITLKFAELYYNVAGARTFNIAINDQQALSNFDIFAAAGGQFIAVDRTFQTTVAGGTLTIAFSGVINSPKVDAIQIVPQGSVPPPPITPPITPPPSPTSAWTRIHAGGGAYTDVNGNVWSADANFQSGSTYATSHAIGNTPDPTLYQTERYGNVQYVIAGMPNGTFSITLKFAELYHNAAGLRIFNVTANDQPVLSNFDIFASAGGQFIAVDRTFQATVTNGTLTIALTPVVDNPKVDAIQIVQTASGPGLPATSAATFLSSLGVNTHVSQGYKAANYVAPLQYLGIRNIRDGDLNLPVTYALHQQTGVLVDLLMGCSDFSGPGSLLPSVVQYLASTASLLALEGPNEPNNWPISYLGQQGGGSGSWLPVAQCQRDFYSTIKSNPTLSSYPVVTVSQGGAEADNVGLQFLTIPGGAGTLMPAGTQYGDYANTHNYVSSNIGNLYEDNQSWLAADPQQNGFPGDTLYVNFGATWAGGYSGYSANQLQSLPRVSTETGWDSANNPGGESVQGKVLTNTYLDQFARGWSYTFIYQLIDGEGGASNQGLFHADYTPKLAATYIHNLTTILADNAPLGSPGLVNYSIPNLPATVHVLLLQKSTGSFELVIWDERVGGSDTITLNLGASFATVKIYDITTGATPVQTLSNASLVPLTLTDHALILSFQ